ncbi:hypothetical protein GCM10009554_48770 [Kribbella koreensis]|uniref:DUF4175 domain-containing protein n=2 Tax=Kribbella TaxID=182639 RepID=A0ABP6Z3Q5_9ACTN
MTRFLLSVGFFGVLSVGVGFLLSGDDFFDWWTALGLFALALVGEGVRFRIRRGRTETRQSSEI